MFVRKAHASAPDAEAGGEAELAEISPVDLESEESEEMESEESEEEVEMSPDAEIEVPSEAEESAKSWEGVDPNAMALWQRAVATAGAPQAPDAAATGGVPPAAVALDAADAQAPGRPEPAPPPWPITVEHVADGLGCSKCRRAKKGCSDCRWWCAERRLFVPISFKRA